MIGCPVRDRAWILPQYLQALLSLDYPREKIEYVFVVNDSRDDSLKILQEFQNRSTSPVRIIELNLGNNRPSHRGGYNIIPLVTLRNKLLEIFLQTECGYLFSVDSDILLKPESLKTLISMRKQVVSLLVSNGHHLGKLDYYNILFWREGRFIPMVDFEPGQLIRVDCTGAAYLIERSMVEELGVRYHRHRQGEDAGFCRDAAEKGISLWCYTGLEGDHVMYKLGVQNSL